HFPSRERLEDRPAAGIRKRLEDPVLGHRRARHGRYISYCLFVVKLARGRRIAVALACEVRSPALECRDGLPGGTSSLSTRTARRGSRRAGPRAARSSPGRRRGGSLAEPRRHGVRRASAVPPTRRSVAPGLSGPLSEVQVLAGVSNLPGRLPWPPARQRSD